MRVPLASGAYKEVAPGTPARVCENFYLEKVDTDPKRPLKLVRTPGSLKLPDWASNARGYAQADGFAGGKILVVVGTALKTYDPSNGNIGTIAGTVAGVDRVQFAFTATECAILGNGVIHVSDGATVAATTDGDFPTGITSIWSIGQRVLFSYGDAGRWGYTEVLDVDNTTALSYYTAESAPDGLVSGKTHQGAVSRLYGTQTYEDWYETGDTDNPFRRGSGQVQTTGCLCRDAIIELDSSPYWIDQESQLRRNGNAETPEIVSTPAISRAIRAETASNIVAWKYLVDGHAFIGIRLTTGTYVFDANSGEWHTRITNQTATWRYGYVISAAGRHYVGDFDGVGFAILSRDYRSEHMADATTMGTEIVSRGSGFASISEGVEPVHSLRIEGAKGQGLSSGQGTDPVMLLRIWKGKEWSNWLSRLLGAQGEYRTRTIFRRLGQHRAPGFYFEYMASDPVVLVVDGCAINED